METSAKWAEAGGWAARTALGAELLHFSLLLAACSLSSRSSLPQCFNCCSFPERRLGHKNKGPDAQESRPIVPNLDSVPNPVDVSLKTLG